MGMKESVKAYKAAGMAADFHWWDKKTAVHNLKSLLHELEESGDDAKLCCRPGLDSAGVVTLWLYVEQPTQTRSHDEGDPLNASHPCPPLC